VLNPSVMYAVHISETFYARQLRQKSPVWDLVICLAGSYERTLST